MMEESWLKMKESIPLYKIVYESIKGSIESSIYKPNELLPSEQELQKEFDVSRITVRRALQELELSGYVNRVHGKGTYVEQRKQFANLVGASSFSSEVAKLGERASSIILDFREMKSNVVISEYLQIPVNSDVYYLKRLRLKNGRIVGVNETYIAQLPGLTIERDELNETTSIYKLYAEKGYSILRATETIEAKIPNKVTRMELYMLEGEPVFHRERITYVENDLPIEYSINTYKADEYKYVINLVKEAL